MLGNEIQGDEFLNGIVFSNSRQATVDVVMHERVSGA